jgi:hypothetical protein
VTACGFDVDGAVVATGDGVGRGAATALVDGIGGDAGSAVELISEEQAASVKARTPPRNAVALRLISTA